MRPTPLPPHGVPAEPGRRGVVLGAVALGTVALTGCSLNNPFGDSRTPADEALPDLEPDVALAVEAVGAILGVRTGAEQIATSYPRFAARLQPLVALHTAHLARLDAAVPSGVDPTPTATPGAGVPARAQAWSIQRAAEVALRDQLRGLAVRAESGPFARLLGAMGAAISQQLTALDRTGGLR